MLERKDIRKIFFITILLIFAGQNLFSLITRKKADKVFFILNSLKSKKSLPKNMVLKEDELNSYFHFYRKRIFTDEVKFIRVYLYDNFIKLRLIYKPISKKHSKIFSIFKDSIFEIKGEFNIKNLGKRCFKVDFRNFFINNVPINKKMIYTLLKTLGDDYISYLERYCIKQYKIKRVKIKKKILIILTD